MTDEKIKTIFPIVELPTKEIAEKYDKMWEDLGFVEIPTTNPIINIEELKKKKI